LNIEALQSVRIHLKPWIGFQNHVVLVELRVHRIDLALSESVIQGVVDVEGAIPSRDAVARSMISETASPPVC